MQHPTKAQVQTVIATLERAQEMADGDCPVSMHSCEVEYQHPCGTPMCHAGWYAVASMQEQAMNGALLYDSFLDGAMRLSLDLGFVSSDELEGWAQANAGIWGNAYGEGLFASDAAFGLEKVTNLQQIIDHWKGVQSRLPL